MSIKLSGGVRRHPGSSVAAGFERALAEHRAGHRAAAEAGYRAVLRQAPHHLGALQNLGTICRASGRHDEALTLYRRALAHEPGADDVRLNLGNLLNGMGRHVEAEAAFREILQRRPNDPRTLFGLGIALARQPNDAAAVEILERLVAVEPEHRLGLRNLAVTLGRLDRDEASLAAYERLLALEPDNANVRYLVDALRGNVAARAPAGYVRMFFDSYAAGFETSLKGKLAYRTPELLAGLLTGHARPEHRFVSAVDLGCGTGLMAPLLRPFCERLEGVDLSPAMIGEAEKKGLYDALATDDIVEFLDRGEALLDLVTAADVFVYLGDLAPVFAAVARRLNAGGLFLFSTEHLSLEEDFRLQPTARFAHGGAYLDRLAPQHGFSILARATATIRRERSAGVVGGLYLLRREGDLATVAGLARAQALFKAGRIDEAATLYAGILAGAPDHPVALDRLAAIHGHQGRAEAALTLYRRALEQTPHNPTLHLGIGRTLNQLHDFAGATPHLRRAAELAPDAAVPRIALAFALLYTGAAAEAEAVAAEATRLDPGNPAAEYVLAKILALGGDLAAAGEALGRARALGLDPGLLGDLEHLIHGRPGGAAALETLRDKYDRTAAYYESHVLAGLQNRAWRLLLELLDRHVDPAARFASGLDLGCGPGVAGEALRRRVGRLTGVDLSPAMIEQARKRGAYDRLATADLTAFLGDLAEDGGFDLVFSSDVLIHVEDLGPLMRAAADRLRPGGMFLFSTEHGEAEDCAPLPDYRFSHSLGHVEHAATAAGLAMLAHEVRQIRVERGAPVMGGLYLLRRPV